MYILGIILGVLAGLISYMGQILQKKAINDFKKERACFIMKELVKKPLWIIGFLMMILVGGILSLFAQTIIGPVLMPGLFASGFIVLGIGSIKILREEVKRGDIIAISMLIIGIVFISLSKLVIEVKFDLFYDMHFIIRLIVYSFVFYILWAVFYFSGKSAKKNKVILMSLGSGFPFIINNIWTLPMIISARHLLNGQDIVMSLLIFIPSFALVILTTIYGTMHVQNSMALGYANIVIPIKQVPQQISPIIIYFFIYNLRLVNNSSGVFIILGIVLVISAGFILSRRQAKLESALKPC